MTSAILSLLLCLQSSPNSFKIYSKLTHSCMGLMYLVIFLQSLNINYFPFFKGCTCNNPQPVKQGRFLAKIQQKQQQHVFPHHFQQTLCSHQQTHSVASSCSIQTLLVKEHDCMKDLYSLRPLPIHLMIQASLTFNIWSWYQSKQLNSIKFTRITFVNLRMA